MIASLEKILKKAVSGLGIAVLAAGLYTGVKAQGIPGLPINYWDSPTMCATCNPSRGVFRDGLHFLDNRLVEFMMDCDNNSSRESNVNRGQFQNTLLNGAYDLVVYAETPIECGYDTLDASRNKGDARVDGLFAYPRNLALTSPGASLQQRLDTYVLYSLRTTHDRITSISTLSWTNDVPEAPMPGSRYDVIRGDIANLRSVGGLGVATITQVACNLTSTSVSGGPELIENPGLGNSFFYVVRPENSSESGNYGGNSNGVARANPVSGDCSL